MRRAAPLAVAAIALAACRVLTPSPTPGPERGDWAHERDAATRHAKLYDVLDHRASATVTYLSPEVREARARRLAEWLGWTDAELAKRLDEERAEASRFDDFIVALYTADRKLNDLDVPKSVWRIAVKLPGADVLPSGISGIDVDPPLQELYPFVSTFDTVYQVRFPRTEPALAGRPFVVELASTLGQLRLDFGAPAKPVPRPHPQR